MTNRLHAVQVLVFIVSFFTAVASSHVFASQSCSHFYIEDSSRSAVGEGRPIWMQAPFHVVRPEPQAFLESITSLEPRAIGDSFERPYQPATGKSVQLKETEVTNQCNTYECYLFSVVNFINVYNKNKRAGNVPIISSEYLVAQKFLEHIREGVLKGTKNPLLVHDLEGGFPFEAVHLTRTVGLIPKNAWRGPKLQDWDTPTIYRILKREVPKAHEEIKKLVERKGSWKAPEVIAFIELKMTELNEYVYKITGRMPIDFEYEGQNFNAKSFERKFGLPRLSLFSIHDRGIYALPDNIKVVLKQAIKEEGGNFKIIPANQKNLLLSIKSYIDQGLPVILDLTWRDDGHSMLVVGYEFNDAGEIVRFKVMNSWGPTFGNKGYAWYTPEDIWKNVTGTYRFDSEN